MWAGWVMGDGWMGWVSVCDGVEGIVVGSSWGGAATERVPLLASAAANPSLPTWPLHTAQTVTHRISQVPEKDRQGTASGCSVARKRNQQQEHSQRKQPKQHKIEYRQLEKANGAKKKKKVKI